MKSNGPSVSDVAPHKLVKSRLLNGLLNGLIVRWRI